jgi:hypothetical protein
MQTGAVVDALSTFHGFVGRRAGSGDRILSGQATKITNESLGACAGLRLFLLLVVVSTRSLVPPRNNYCTIIPSDKDLRPANATNQQGRSPADYFQVYIFLVPDRY